MSSLMLCNCVICEQMVYWEKVLSHMLCPFSGHTAKPCRRSDHRKPSRVSCYRNVMLINSYVN